MVYGGPNQTKKADLGGLNLLKMSSKFICKFNIDWKMIRFYSFSTKHFFCQPLKTLALKIFEKSNRTYADLEKVVNRPQAENSKIYNVLKIT